MTAPDEAGVAPLTGVDYGRVLAGRYELGSTLGVGGMATVLLAHDKVLDRDVAVKVLRGQYATDPEFRERFTREARNAAGLSHPGLVTIFDSGVDHETAFIVMEVVDGQTLREVLRDHGSLPVERAVVIAADVCEVLEVAHSAGVVHRDIKPGNILLARDGRTRVFDFGIARTDGADPLTRTATLIGTPAYLSPEQAAGRAAGPGSDLYALGCVLVEMLTGAPPFRADTPMGVLYQHVNDLPAPPSVTRPEVTPALDHVALRLLAKDPADRPASAALARQELLAAVRPDSTATRLLPAVPDTVAPARPTSPARRRAVVAAILLAAAGLGALIGLQRHAAPSVAAAPATGAPTQTATTPSAPGPTGQTPTPLGSQSAPASLLVPVATTAAEAVDALRSVVRAGTAQGLIVPSAASQLSDSIDAVQAALHKGHGRSIETRIRDLTDLIHTLAGSGKITSSAATALSQALDQLSQVTAQED